MTTARLAESSPSHLAFEAADLTRIARHMYALMLRNIASDGFPFRDPCSTRVPPIFSRPGCVIAAPSYKDNTPGIDQDYVYHWVRDGAITMIEVDAATRGDPDEIEPLVDYVNFSKICQDNAIAWPDKAHPDPFARAAFLVDGQLRDWSDQNDGPAVQTLAMLGFFGRLDATTQATARAIMQKNVDFVAAHYGERTRNLWEEVDGFSFFARSVQLACLRAIKTNAAGVTAPANVDKAIADLETALAGHWNGGGGYYVSVLELTSKEPLSGPYDVNIDIVCAAIYGAVPVTDTKVLASAAHLRAQWADPGSTFVYPINGDDAKKDLGPLLGRYPGDHYDGDVRHPSTGCHPWVLCTANVAELYYRVANAVVRDGKLPLDDFSRPFFAQAKVADAASPVDAAAALREAGDRMLRAILYHSDHLELSEQFDGTSGFERSVRNLTWSYAAFLSAVRARTDTTIV